MAAANRSGSSIGIAGSAAFGLGLGRGEKFASPRDVGLAAGTGKQATFAYLAAELPELENPASLWDTGFEPAELDAVLAAFEEPQSDPDDDLPEVSKKCGDPSRRSLATRAKPACMRRRRTLRPINA